LPGGKDEQRYSVQDGVLSNPAMTTLRRYHDRHQLRRVEMASGQSIEGNPADDDG
jgi:hypothetical protein